MEMGCERFCKAQEEKRNSQGKDPRTFDEKMQGGDLSAPKTTSQEEDQEPLKDLLKGGVFRRSGRKSSGRKGRGQRRRCKKAEYRRTWWKNAKKESQEEEKEKKGRKSDNSPRTRQVLVKSGRWLFLLMLLVTELAMCQRCSRDNGKVAATRS